MIMDCATLHQKAADWPTPGGGSAHMMQEPLDVPELGIPEAEAQSRFETLQQKLQGSDTDATDYFGKGIEHEFLIFLGYGLT